MTAFVITAVTMNLLAALLSLITLAGKPSWINVFTVLLQGSLGVWGLFLLLK